MGVTGQEHTTAATTAKGHGHAKHRGADNRPTGIGQITGDPAIRRRGGEHVPHGQGRAVNQVLFFLHARRQGGMQRHHQGHGDE